jgi:hypothetical protein
MVAIKMCAGYLGSSRVVSALLQHTRPYSLSGPGLQRAIRSEPHHATTAALPRMTDLGTLLGLRRLLAFFVNTRTYLGSVQQVTRPASSAWNSVSLRFILVHVDLVLWSF